jgi:hypothetical protein
MKKCKAHLSIVRPAVLREPESRSSDPYLVCDKITLSFEKVFEVKEVSEVGTVLLDDGMVLTRVMDVGYDIKEDMHVLFLEDYPRKPRRAALRRKLLKPVGDSVLLVSIEQMAQKGWKPTSKVVSGDGQLDQKGKTFIESAEARIGTFPLEVINK